MQVMQGRQKVRNLTSSRGRRRCLSSPSKDLLFPERPDCGSLTFHSRQWFAVAAFPLVAGTFGPVATAMNICALVQPWRRTVVADKLTESGKNIPDPHWYLLFLLSGL